MWQSEVSEKRVRSRKCKASVLIIGQTHHEIETNENVLYVLEGQLKVI